MQLPTCTKIRIRSTQDAHKIFFAVQRRLLPMVTRRLDADERLALRSGCVYAWEERGPHTEITGLGIERFTEGRRWSPSRVRDEFLFYYEKYSPPQDAQSTSSERDRQPPRDWDPLVKQTYSVWVDTEKGRRKWHLTAYFTQATVDQLGTIDDMSGIGELVVPDGLFQSTRISKNRKSDDSRGRSADTSKPLTSSVTRTYAPFPSTYPVAPLAQTEPPQAPQLPPQLYEPYPQIASYPHPQNYYQDVQMPQYSIPPPLPPPGSQYALPPIRSSQSSSYEHRNRTTSPPSQEYPPHDSYDRRPSADYGQSRPQTRPYSSTSDIGADHVQSPPAHYGTPISSYESQQFLSGSEYTSTIRSSPTASATGDVAAAILPHPPWYPSPPSTSQPTFDRQSHPFAIRTDLPTSYPLRPSYAPSPQDQEPEPPSPALSYAYSNSPSSSYPPYRSSASTSPSQCTTSSSPSDAHLPRVSPPPSVPGVPASPYEYESSVRTGCIVDGESKSTSVGPCRRVGLAPLHSLQRSHPYRRDPVDDKALRLLRPRPS